MLGVGGGASAAMALAGCDAAIGGGEDTHDPRTKSAATGRSFMRWHHRKLHDHMDIASDVGR